MFGGSWNTQQAQPQQQQQQTGGLFGGGAGAGAFGQPQGQQQQQQQAGGFGQPAGGGGLFGGAGAATGGGFGAGGFGAPAATATPNAFGATQARPTFGATGTTTGGGLFGGSAGTFGSSGGFGAAAAPQASSGGLFGSSTNAFGAKPATTTFGAAAGGTTGGLFGAKPAATGFGAPAIANALPQPVTNGSLAPPYAPLREKDGTAANAGWGVYNTITCMPEYRGTSLEEIRLQDYAAGRKVAPPAGSTGATGFGAQPAQGGLFGQPAAQQSTGLFGQPAAQTNAFGQPAAGATGTGLFGAAQQNTTNAFGQPQQAQPNAFGQPAQQSTGLFGQPAQQNTGAGLFGQTQPAQQAGGLFGAAPTQPSTGLFGATNNTAGTQSTGLFGQQNTASTGFGGFGAAQQPQQAKPAFGFGAPAATAPATNTGFGQPAQNTTTPSFGFGQPQQQPGASQPAAGGFGFGATGAQPAGTGLFGASQPQQQGGLFGAQQNNAPKPGGLFGSTPAQPAAGGLFGSTGGFGANTQQQQQQQPTTSLFGNTNTANTNTGGGLFGSTQNNQTNTAGQPGATNTGGLFGGGFGMQNKPATTTGTGLFGSTNTTAQQPGTSLFGNTGATGGFGATGAAGGGTSLFGNNQTNQQQQPGAQPAGQTGGLFSGGSLFGNNNANKPAGTSLFGSTGPAQQTNTGGGLFGNLGQSQNQQQQQQQQAPGFGTGSLFGNQSTNNNSLGNSQVQQQMPQINPNDPYGSGNLFANPPNFAPINTSTTKTLPPLTSSFKAMPTPVKQPLRLRGYAASPGVNSPRLGGSTLGNSALGLSTASSGSSMRGSLFDRPSTDVLSPAAFTPRSSVKKLVIDKRITGANLAASLSQSTRTAVDRNLINPDADGDVGNGNVSLFGGNESVSGTPSRSVSAAVKANTNGKSVPPPKALNSLSRNVDLADFEEGEYYTIPDMHSLCNAAHEELKTVDDFVVGRKGFGELRYLEPVDVASVGDLKSICGQYVVFQRGTCEVYPEGTASLEPGNGLNHHARITLEKCFPKDKSTGEPVTDPTAPRVQQHMRKLKAMDGTSFQSYDPHTGTWVFEVDHFTKYGLDDNDDDEDMENMEQQSNHSVSPSARGSPSSLPELPEPSVTTRSPSAVEGSVTASFSSHNDESDSQSGESQYEDAKLKLSVFEQDFTPKASRFVDQQSHLSYFHEAEEDDVREFDMTHVKPTSFGYQLPSSFQPTWTYQSIPGTSSLASKHENSELDLGASQCRSFGVGWSHQGSLVSYGKVASLASGNQFQPFNINQKSLPGVKVANEKERLRMQEMVDLSIERSDIQVDDGVPFIRTQNSLRFQHLTGLFAGDKSQEAQAWRLGAALFDPIENNRYPMENDDLMIDMDAFSRKMAFSDWLESSVAPAVERADLNASEGPEKVFALLSGHRLEEAVNHALHSGDLRLATLLGSIGNEDTKTAMSAQLDAWRKDKVDTHISKDYLRVYALLAGKADLMPVHGQNAINVTEGLDWLRAFALSFWYRTPLEQPIELAVETFQQRLEQVSSLPQPVLKHVSAYRAQQESRPEDALYSLIKIYCRQDRALDVLSDPARFGKTAGEARVQWHVCDLLLNVLGYGSDEDEEGTRDLQAFDRLTVAYGDQLESADLWTSAVFVLLHLSEENARVKAVKDLLLRHVESLSDETTEFLVNLLCVPASWIAEAKAFHHHAQGEIYSEFLASLEAGLFNRAHGIVMDRLASEAVLRDDVGLLKKLLVELEDENVEDWANGGSTLLDYADIVETVPVLLQSLQSPSQTGVADAGTGEALERVKALLPSVASRIEGLWRHGTTRLSDADVALQNRAAKTQMLEVVYRFAGDLADHEQMTRLKPSEELPEASRLKLMQEAALDRFTRRLQVM